MGKENESGTEAMPAGADKKTVKEMMMAKVVKALEKAVERCSGRQEECPLLRSLERLVMSGEETELSKYISHSGLRWLVIVMLGDCHSMDDVVYKCAAAIYLLEPALTGNKLMGKPFYDAIFPYVPHDIPGMRSYFKYYRRCIGMIKHMNLTIKGFERGSISTEALQDVETFLQHLRQVRKKELEEKERQKVARRRSEKKKRAAKRRDGE